MQPTSLDELIRTLTEREPSYVELRTVYDELIDTGKLEDGELIVARRALAQVVGEMIDYLSLVETELEKAVGLTQERECRRLLNTLERPSSTEPVEQVAEIVDSWLGIERYRFDEATDSRLLFH
ncbi:hypothetical protein ACLI4Z_10520 [Natrialbaceae archaeon A-arb3/5]